MESWMITTRPRRREPLWAVTDETMRNCSIARLTVWFWENTGDFRLRRARSRASDIGAGSQGRLSIKV